MENKQRGITFIGLVLSLAVIVVGSLLAMRLLPIYIENYNVKSSLSGLKDLSPEEMPQAATGIKGKLRKSLRRRLDINSVDNVKSSNIQISVVEGGYKVQVKYDVTNKLIGNIDVLIHFDDSVVVNPKNDS